MSIQLWIISGKKRSGKDTVANIIKSYYEYEMGVDVLSIAFADRLKIMTVKILNKFNYRATMKMCWSNRKDNIYFGGRSLRQWLQFIGTDIIRENLGDDVWCRCVDKEILEIAPDVCIISDARFENEVKYFKENKNYNCHSIKIIRDHNANDTHISETNDIVCDSVIKNNRSLATLKRRVLRIIRH